MCRRPSALDFHPPCSYIVPIVDGARSTGSMLDIVDQKWPAASPGSAEPNLSRCLRQNAEPVNFLYMRLFLGFEKNQVAHADLCVTLFRRRWHFRRSPPRPDSVAIQRSSPLYMGGSLGFGRGAKKGQCASIQVSVSPRRKPGSIFQRPGFMDPGFRRGDTGGRSRADGDTFHAPLCACGDPVSRWTWGPSLKFDIVPC
jgi:hypothetical protein